MRLLLAEDDIVNQQVMVALLEPDGHRIDVAINGHEAVALASAGRYDVVLMDLEMPGQDGLSAARAIRADEAKRGGGARVRIVALTGRDTEADRAACAAAGMDGFLAKPATPEALRAVLEGGAGAGSHPAVAAPASTRPPPADRPAFDGGVIAAMPMVADGSDPTFAAELIAVYSNRTRRLLADLAAAAAVADRDAMIRCVHTMKSSSAMIGALALADRARDWESALRAGATPANGWIDEFDADFARFEIAARAFLANSAGSAAPRR